MRKLDRNKLASLKMLTGLRKAIQAAESTMIQAQIDRKKDEILDLKTPIIDQDNGRIIQDNAPWQDWRRNEVLRLNTEQAAIQARYIQVLNSLGRATAEDETVKHLDKASKAGKSNKQRY